MNTYGFIDPEEEFIHMPEEFNLDYETKYLNKGKTKIITWIFTAKEKRKNSTIIIAYGDSGNMSYTLGYIKEYLNNGFDVVTFDYRGFGKSSAFEVNKDLLYTNEYAKDLTNVIQFTKTKFKKNSIGLVGLSMGTILAAKAFQKESVDFMILDSCVYNPKEIKYRLKQKNINTLLPKSDHEISFNRLWNDIESKILILNGDQDKITTKKDSELIVSQDPKNRKLILYQGNHLQGIYKLEGYITEIIQFLKNYEIIR